MLKTSKEAVECIGEMMTGLVDLMLEDHAIDEVIAKNDRFISACRAETTDTNELGLLLLSMMTVAECLARKERAE